MHAALREGAQGAGEPAVTSHGKLDTEGNAWQ